MYKEKRPDKMLAEGSLFYIGINKKSKGDAWYVSKPLGKNTLGNIVKSMCEEAGIQGRKVNHSARKTAITTLVHAGVPLTPVQQHSGHKSLASMNNYSTASLNQQKDMSDQVVIFSKASETVGTPQEFSENFDGLDTVFQDIGNFEFNINIVNNMFTTASVPFPQLKELFTSATINGNVKINFGKQ